MTKNKMWAVMSTGLCAVLCGCATAQVTGRNEIGTARKPVVIYVADFDLDAANIKARGGMLPAPPKLPGPLGDVLPPLPGTAKDPQVVARDVVDSMSTGLVKDLTKAGLTARRLGRGEAVPKSGWLVRGVFTQVDQGNQLTRAMIGFGAGKTDVQVFVDISELGQEKPRPFYELTTTANSGKAPGAAPMIILSPPGAAARFVIAGKDLNKNVKQTASKIAAEVVGRTSQTQSPTRIVTT
jgi:hypothetical protein